MTKLLGDLTQDTLKAFGADKLVQYYERKTGRACNCAARREMLNNVHRAAQRAFDRSKIRPPTIPAPVPTPAVHQPPTKPVDE